MAPLPSQAHVKFFLPQTVILANFGMGVFLLLGPNFFVDWDLLEKDWLCGMSVDILGEGWLLGGDLLAGEFCSKLMFGDGNSIILFYFNRVIYFNITACYIFFKVLFLEFIVFVVLVNFFIVHEISKLISVTSIFFFFLSLITYCIK